MSTTIDKPNLARPTSEKLFDEAKQYFPGGVNSPVRAFRSVDGAPLFFKKGRGAKAWDEDGNEFIDFCCSWGPLILGHRPDEVYDAVMNAMDHGSSFGAPTRAENQLAKLILDNNRFIEKIRFVSSGTEAVMSALRLARGITGKSKVLKFDGCYHGHVDSLLVSAGSGLATLGTSNSAGVPEGFAQETIVAPLNDLDALDKVFEQYVDDLACVIIEPIPANNGLLLQEKGFLTALREKCSEHCVLLIFDEVISGFRVGFEGAAGLYDIQPDIITYGKIIGGGLPVGAYGASSKLMSQVSPDGPVYQAGTLSGNPVAMSAGYAQLKVCSEPGFYEDQEKRTLEFVSAINEHAKDKRYQFRIFSIGSIFWLSFDGEKTIRQSAQINADMSGFKKLYAHFLANGLYFGPSGYEVGFISKAHSPEILEDAVTRFKKSLDDCFAS